MDLVFCITNDSWDINKIKGNGMKSKIRYIFLLVPISIIVFFAYVISQSQNEASQPLNLELPEFQLQTLDDKTLSDKDISSGTYLINVWASWCITCRVEHPFLIDLKDKGVPIIGLNYKDNKDDAINRLEKLFSDIKIQAKRIPTKPSWSSKVKRVETKKRRSQVKKSRMKVSLDD